MDMRQYEQVRPQEVAPPTRIQWSRAVAAGFIAGAILLIVPRGSPWEGLAFSEPVIMGRHFPGMPVGLVWLIHLAVAILYSLIICRLIASSRIGRALVMAVLVGLVLYVLNLAGVAFIWHAAPTSEVPVIFTHIVFALIAAGAYRGLLRRRIAA